MGIKSKLPQGIYTNNEYLLHIKRVRDTLWPILRYAKTIPSYQDKCKIKGDHLVINRINYGIHDISKLPSERAAYKATQKEDDHYIAFHRELRPYSSFYQSKFTINNHSYFSSEQWIQFQKVMLFRDSLTANQILTCSTPYEAKHLSYNINGFDAQRWKLDGYELFLDRISKKCLQNPPLL